MGSHRQPGKSLGLYALASRRGVRGASEARALAPWQGCYRSWPVSEKWYHFHPMRTHPVAIAPVPGCR